MTKTLEQALAPASVILLFIVLYTGFAIPIEYMKGYVDKNNPTSPTAC
jgi:hypothetical protein